MTYSGNASTSVMFAISKDRNNKIPGISFVTIVAPIIKSLALFVKYMVIYKTIDKYKEFIV
jgi:hypothetical protein